MIVPSGDSFHCRRFSNSTYETTRGCRLLAITTMRDWRLPLLAGNTVRVSGLDPSTLHTLPACHGPSHSLILTAVYEDADAGIPSEMAAKGAMMVTWPSEIVDVAKYHISETRLLCMQAQCLWNWRQRQSDVEWPFCEAECARRDF
ncbi:hypothetical protein LIA77_03834 [Sarocladium implicatum]|nr:hypothetical protein LIA77_03834 [Sarocladium implicatum]